MPSPTSPDVTFNKVLTDISIAYVQDTDKYIADKVFPVIPVELQGGEFVKYNRGDWFRDEATERAPGTESGGSGFDLDNRPTYYARVYAHHKDVSDQDRANAVKPIDLDRDATEFVTQRLLLRREVQFINTYMQAGVWTTQLTGVSGAPGANQFKQWDQSGSTPIEDIENNILAMEELTGYRPNTLVLAPMVFNALKNHSEVLDRIKYTQRGLVTAELLSSLLEIEKVLVARAVRNTANKGAADAMSFIVGPHALLCYAEPNPGILKPSAGYIFAWTGYEGAESYAPAISQFRMQHLKSDRIEGEMAFDTNLVAADLGLFFQNATASSTN